VHSFIPFLSVDGRMKFVIVGAGRVGLRAARALRDAHDVVLVEPVREAAERARAEGLEVIEGDGSLEATLREAGIESADALGALTGDLNDNFAACMIAKQYGCRTVMRIDEDYREDIYRKYAGEVDEVIYPERLGALIAKNALVGGNSRAIADIEEDLQLVEFAITEASPMRGYSLSELELPSESRLIAFSSANESLRIPTPDDTLDRGARLVILTDFEKLDDVRHLITGDTSRAAAGGV